MKYTFAILSATFLLIPFTTEAASPQDKGRTSLTMVSFNDWPAFETSAKYGVQTLKHLGYSGDLKIFEGKDLPPNVLNKMGVDTGALREGKKAIADFLKDKGSQKVLHVMDHGGFIVPTSEEVSIVFGNGRLGFKEFNQMIKKHKAPGSSLKMIMSQCYGADAHTMAIENENTCILSPVDEGQQYQLPKKGLSTFDKAVFDNLKNKGTLFSAYLDGTKADNYNTGSQIAFYGASAQLSSQFYAKKILGIKPKESVSNSNLEEYIQELGQALDQCSPLSPAIGSDDESKASMCKRTNSAENLLKDVDKAFDRYTGLQTLSFKISPEELQLLPESHRLAFQKVEEHTRAHFPRYKEALLKGLENIEKDKKDWRKAQSKYHQCLQTNEVHRCRSEYFDLTEASERITKNMTSSFQNISDLTKNLKIVENLRNVAQALQKAKPAEKTKLQSLLKCEAESL